ncbi:hypothetical protein ACFQ58_15345 [Agromyces sp. NPDC056523]|uniref:hypothetical protein n=1 Tax=Agromyces sp. NPDC056523 TaxID=3345850 RepID=UPI00367334BD
MARFFVIAGFIIVGVLLIAYRDRVAARNRENLTAFGRPGLTISRRSTPATIAFVGFSCIVAGCIGLAFAISKLTA